MEARPPAKNRHGGAPRGERPASWDAPRLTRADQSRLANATNEIVRLSALRPPSSGRARMDRDQPGRRNASRERDVLRGTRPRSGLFDIVKKDGARAMPRAAFAFARARSHISGSRALRHRRPSASDVQAAGGLERNRFGRNYGFAPGIFLVAWSHRKPASFEIMLRPGRTAMTNAESNENRRTPRHAAARSCASNRQSPGHAGPWTRRATL